MAKKLSKQNKKDGVAKKKVETKNSKTKKMEPDAAKQKRISRKIERIKAKRQERKKERVHPHRSFRRSYREDYNREIKVPGVLYHILSTLRILGKNWKLFLPLLVIVVFLNIVFVGMMDESNYTKFKEVLDETSLQVAGGDIGNVAKAGLLLVSTITTGGLSNENESSSVFGVLIFLIVWLTTIYLLRHRMVGHKMKLRDGLYNAMSPIISTFLIFVTILIQCIPIFALIIAYSAAVQTEFLATPFYALVFFVFAAVMILISAYLLSSSLMAMVAVSAPGLYPMQALRATSDLMMSRRIKFLIRLVALIIALAIMWMVVMLPIIVLDLWLKTFEWAEGLPLVPIFLLMMTCFTEMYIAAYLYMYYRWMLDGEGRANE